MTSPARKPDESMHALRTIDFAEVEAAKARASRVFDPLRGGSKSLVVFGAAHLGRRIRHAAARAGLNVLAYADNNGALWDTKLDGLPIFAPRDAVSTFNNVATFVVAVFNPSRPRAQLRELGCRFVTSYPEFFWSFGQFISGITGMAMPEHILDQMGEVRAAYELLGDDHSRAEFAAQVDWRCTLDRSVLPTPSAFADQYFDPQIFALRKDEIVVDCGAFDGDTLRAFERRSVESTQFYALEPDSLNRAALTRYVNEMPPSKRAAIVVLPYAVGSKDEMIPFDMGFGMASGVSAGAPASTMVPSRRLDSVINTNPTLIKMDLEGLELEALRGAEQLIARARPVLCVTAYHCCEHLWQIPLLINNLCADYTFYLRRYAEDCWETVVYAIPPERKLH